MTKLMSNARAGKLQGTKTVAPEVLILNGPSYARAETRSLF